MTAAHASDAEPTIRVWALAGAAELARAADAVEAAIRAELGVADRAAFEVVVHPNGFVDAFRPDAAAPVAAPTLPRADDAERRAKALLAGLARRLGPLASGERPVVFVPPLPARPLELLAVAAPGQRRWDHWLYRTQPQLTPAPGARALPVFGAQLEVRIGDGGQVIGFHARWRPLSGATRAARVTAWTAPTDGHGHDHDGPAAAHRPPAMAYVLEGAAVPQQYLAPYYLVTAGHHFQFASASEMSLLVGLSFDDDETSTGVTCDVAGGSGQFEFRWAATSLIDPGADRVDLGAGDVGRDAAARTQARIRVPKGAWLIAVHVLDRATGAFKHHQEAVHSAPFAVRGAPAFALPDDTSLAISERELPVSAPAVA